MKVLPIKLPDELYQKLKQVAEEEGVSMAALIRSLIEKPISEYSKKHYSQPDSKGLTISEPGPTPYISAHSTQKVTSTLTQAYQTVVPAKVRRLIQAKPGDILTWEVNPVTQTAEVRTKPIMWGTLLLGIGKGTWGEDVEGYIRVLRKDRKIG